jgi:hypothetical protein
MPYAPEGATGIHTQKKIQLLTNLKLRGDHVGFTEKTQNETDD